MLDDHDSTPTLGDEAPTNGPASGDATTPAPDAPPADSGAAESAPDTRAPASDRDPADEVAAPDDAGDRPAAKKTARKSTRKATSRPRKTAASAAAASGGGAPTGTVAEEGDAVVQAPLPDTGLEQVPTPGEEPGQTPAPSIEAADGAAAPAKKAAKRAPAKRTATKKTAARKTAASTGAPEPSLDEQAAPGEQPGQSPAPDITDTDAGIDTDTGDRADSASGAASEAGDTAPASSAPVAPLAATSLLFQAPDPVVPPRRRPRRSAAVVVPGPERKDEPATHDTVEEPAADATAEVGDAPEIDGAAPEVDADTTTDDTGTDDVSADDTDTDADAEGGETDDGATSDEQGTRRRRRRGGRRRRRGAGDGDGDDSSEVGEPGADAGESATAEPSSDDQGGGGRGSGRGQRDSQRSGTADDAEAQDEGTGSRRRRRRRRSGEDDGGDEPGTTARVRKPRNAEDEITSLHGSTRLEAKKQRRREGREAGRRRAPIVSEAEFLARREAVERVMVIRQKQDLTQIAVLEDKVLVEHYVARESQTSLIGNVYLGRVQNVLPSMEAAFIDIGRGRNAVLYAGEVNWDALGAGNGPRKIEQVLKSGQPILVQVSKDPIGHKGARLTSQVSLPGRFLVYVPDGTTSGISRKLPDTERSRLKSLLKEMVPDSAGVIVRTAAEGASEEELTLDVERLKSRWAEIEAKIAAAPKTGGGPQLLYGEPDLTLKVVRDLFTEDFAQLVISGDDAWDTVDGYVKDVAPDLEERLERYDGEQDIFAAYRVDEQIAKGLDRKVWLPSGGSLVIDRTEAMTVVDVNTGKFTGSGGNLEETVTKNNLEAAEEIVRQLRLRDIGGIIVVDFIDMVLESNRDLVLRRLVECLGRDRTRHQVAEVTSLGLVQMTRKRIGTGLLESFSENCDHCQGRGVIISHEPVEPRKQQDDEPRRGGRRGRGRDNDAGPTPPAPKGVPSPKDLAAMARHEPKPPVDLDAAADGPTDGATESLVEVSGDAPTEVPVDVSGDAQAESLVEVSGDAPTEVPVDVSSASWGEESGGEVAVPSLAGPQVTSPPTDDDAPASPAADTAPVDVPQSDEPPVAPVAAAPSPSVTAVDGLATPDGSAEPSQPVAPPVPVGPRLVTSTRRRVARRPAGPPSTVAADGGSDGAAPRGTGTLVEDDETDDVSGQDGDATGADAPHVPVKKRGRRR